MTEFPFRFVVGVVVVAVVVICAVCSEYSKHVRSDNLSITSRTTTALPSK